MKKAVLLLTALILLTSFLSGCEDYDLYESNQSSPSISETTQLSDLEILFKNGHPRFYGLVDDAKACWKDYPSSKIDIPSYGVESDTAILSGKCDHPNDSSKTNHIIELEFCLDRTDVGSVDMPTATSIIKDYFPSSETIDDCKLVESYKCKTGTTYWTYLARYSVVLNSSVYGIQDITHDIYLQLGGPEGSITSIWFTSDRPY